MLKVLLIDDEEDILEVLEMAFDVNTQADFVFAHSGQEAIERLNSDSFDLVVCDYNMPDGTGGDVYSYILKNAVETRFVLCSSDRPDFHAAFNNQDKLFHFIEKPFILKGVKDCLSKLDHLKVQDTPEEYHPVSIKLLYNIEYPPVDIFLKVSTTKYIKVLHALERFDALDFVKYTQKSIFNLYVKTEDFSSFYKVCEKEIEKRISSLSSESDSAEQALSIANCHEILVNMFQSFGFSKNLNYAATMSLQVAEEMISNSKELSLLLDKILNNPHSYITKHSLLLSVMTKMIASDIGWSNSIMDKKLVAASLFHDIALKEDFNESTYHLNKKPSEDFLNHSQVAAQIIEKIEEVPHDTHVIVLEQHEVGSSLGVPRGLHFSRVSPLGLLFSFSHYFVDYVLEFSDCSIAVERMKDVSQRTGQYKTFYKSLLNLELSKKP